MLDRQGVASGIGARSAVLGRGCSLAPAGGSAGARAARGWGTVNAHLISALHSLPVALAPVSELGFVLQLAALGSAVGSLVALRRPRAAAPRITAAWSALGFVLGVAILTASVFR